MPGIGLKLAKSSDKLFYLLSIPLILSFYFSYLSFVAFVPFFFFYEKKPAFELSFFTFFPFALFLYSGIFKSLYVYYGLNFFVALVLFFLIAFYHFIYLFMSVYAGKKLKLGVVFLPFLFVVFEYLKSVVFYGLPLGNMNLLVWNIPFFIKSASYFGAYFVSLEMLFVNVAVYLLLKRRALFVPVFVFLALCMFLPSQRPKSSFTKTISIVQGGIPQNEKWDDKYLNRNIAIYIKATRDLRSDIVFWPESAYPYVFEKNNNFLVGFARNYGIKLVSGVIREEKNRYYNSVVFIDNNKIDYYNKQILVPFAEFVPLRSVIGAFLPDSMDPGDFSRGKHNVIFKDGLLRIGPMICYEEAFGSISRRYKDKGANLLAVLTNDAWFAKTPTFYMLGRNAIFRAVENSIWLVRVANNGISEIISPNGDVVAKLKPYKKGVLTKKLRITITSVTVFDRYGYLFPVFLLAFVSLLIFYRICKLRKSKG